MIKIKKPKLLILGGSSLLSWLMVKEMKFNYDIFLSKYKKDISKINLPIIDISNISIDSIVSAIEKNSIDIVLNTIGLTSIEECEKNPQNAYKINSKMPGYIAKACLKTNTKLIHISTDLLYGYKHAFHSENDDTELLNIYAKSKYQGELEVISNNKFALICRTNFFGDRSLYKKSFSSRIYDNLKKGEKIFLFKDVMYNPVDSSTLAKVAHQLLNTGANGIYNVSADDSLSKYEFGLKICNKHGFSENLIKGISIFDRNDLVKRPTSMTLSNKKLVSLIGQPVGTIESMINNLSFNIK